MTYLFDILYLHLASDIFTLSNVLTEIVVSVLQLSYDLTWQKLKEKFSHCGMSSTLWINQNVLNLNCLQIFCQIKHSSALCETLRFKKSHLSFLSTAGQVMFAEIKMENGKSKGCGTVRFDSPESAEKACRMMNGTKINGREVDVRIDRNA